MVPPETAYEREPGYAVRYRDTRFRTGTGARTHRRESVAIRALLERAVPDRDRGAERPWLDVPCGAGRLTALLPAGAVQVDRDLAMVHAAAEASHDGESRACCARAARLPFADGSFAGVLCMRLFQHIPGSEERVAILAELRRVSDGPLVASFFDAWSLPHLRRVIRRRLRGRRNTGRNGILWTTFRRELRAAGWEPEVARPLARVLSEQWLVLAR